MAWPGPRAGGPGGGPRRGGGSGGGGPSSHHRDPQVRHQGRAAGQAVARGGDRGDGAAIRQGQHPARPGPPSILNPGALVSLGTPHRGGGNHAFPFFTPGIFLKLSLLKRCSLSCIWFCDGFSVFAESVFLDPPPPTAKGVGVRRVGWGGIIGCRAGPGWTHLKAGKEAPNPAGLDSEVFEVKKPNAIKKWPFWPILTRPAIFVELAQTLFMLVPTPGGGLQPRF